MHWLALAGITIGGILVAGAGLVFGLAATLPDEYFDRLEDPDEATSSCERWNSTRDFRCGYHLVVKNLADETVDLRVELGHVVFSDGVERPCAASGCVMAYSHLDHRLSPGERSAGVQAWCDTSQPGGWGNVYAGDGNGTTVHFGAIATLWPFGNHEEALDQLEYVDEDRPCDQLGDDFVYQVVVTPDYELRVE